MYSFSGGVGGGRSGSPGDGGTTCVICHAAGANFNASAVISTNIPLTGYELNTAYTITVTATSTAPGHGFQLTAERLSDNAKIGSFTDDAGVTTRVQDAGERISHANRNNSSWTFTWTSPSTDQGAVGFYASVNAVNNNGSNGGDQVVTASLTEPSLSVAQSKVLQFEMYPNPAPTQVRIQLPSGVTKAEAQVFDHSGRLVLKGHVTSVNNELSVSQLPAGMYIVKVLADGKLGAKKFIKS